MFSLDQAIAQWRRQMRSAGLKRRDLLAELENHLREDIDSLMQAGLEPRQAFDAAVARLGEPEVVCAEFAKVRISHMPSPSQLIRVLCAASAVAVLLVALWTLLRLEFSPVERLARVASCAVIALYFLKLGFLYPGLFGLRNPVSREVVRVVSILPWPLCAYLVPSTAGIWSHVALIAFGSVVPAVVLALSFRATSSGLPFPQLNCFAEPTQQALQRAQLLAANWKHDFVGTEHALLGLIDLDGIVTRVMARMGAHAERVRLEIQTMVSAGNVENPTENLPCTPRLARALDLALSEARLAQARCAAPEHLLLGLLLEGSGVAALVLRKLGIDLATLRQEIIRETGQDSC
jgi:hypothetical protein